MRGGAVSGVVLGLVVVATVSGCGGPLDPRGDPVSTTGVVASCPVPGDVVRAEDLAVHRFCPLTGVQVVFPDENAGSLLVPAPGMGTSLCVDGEDFGVCVSVFAGVISGATAEMEGTTYGARIG